MMNTVRVNTKEKQDKIYKLLGERAVMKLTVEYKEQEISYIVLYVCL